MRRTFTRVGDASVGPETREVGVLLGLGWGWAHSTGVTDWGAAVGVGDGDLEGGARCPVSAFGAPLESGLDVREVFVDCYADFTCGAAHR